MSVEPNGGENRFRNLFDEAADAMLVIDERGCCVEANRAAVTLFGRATSDLHGASIDALTQLHARSDTAGGEFAGEGPMWPARSITRPDGSVRDVEISAGALTRPGLLVLHDVTVRTAVEADLTSKSELLQKILDNVPVMISLSDLSGRITWVNRYWERILGWSLLEVRDIDIIALAYPDPSYRDDVRQFLLDSPPVMRDFRPRSKDGGIIDTSWSSVRMSDGSVVTIGQDVSERVRADRERERRTAQLRKARTRLQALSTRLVQLQEEERQSVARELHDEVGQLLTGLRLMIERENGCRAGPGWDEMLKIVKELINRVRDMSMNLRPPMLDDLGLLPTLLWQIERFEIQTGMTVDFRHANIDRRFAPETELTAFRIIQEGLTNVARHADVRHAKIVAWANLKSLRVNLEDEGSGFDVKAVLGARSSGLSGMAERSRLLGGRFDIESAPNHGTRITVELPAKVRAGERRLK
jgi:PAS domain S-box-containing protein